MNELAFRGRAVYLPAAGTLVVADLHVGRDESSGVEFPLGERADLRERLDALLAHFGPREVAFAGDVLHDFGSVSPDAESSLRELTDCCRDAGARPVLVAGNHDTQLRRVYDGDVRDCYRVAGGAGEGSGSEAGGRDGENEAGGRDGEGERNGGGGDADALVAHGHEEPAERAPLYVVGHDHPAIEIEGRKRPCFLFGPGSYRGGDVLMLPAFNRLAAGATVNGMRAGSFQSPLITDADALRPIVYDPDSQETLSFPPLGELRRLL